MEISILKPVERIVDILHPGTGEPMNIKVGIVSLNDEKTKLVRRKIQNKRIDFEKRGKSFKADDLEDNEIELLINCITSWDWSDNTFHDAVPEFNEKNVKQVLKELPWFKSQVVDAIGDEKAFFQN